MPSPSASRSALRSIPLSTHEEDPNLTDNPEACINCHVMREQHDGWLKGSHRQVRTRFGGSEAVPRTPTEADPRWVVAQSKLEEDPRLKTMWAGYAFATEVREERGHAYTSDDQTYTERQIVTVTMPGLGYTAMKKLGEGDLLKGRTPAPAWRARR